jgi:aminopeptidase 2
MNMYRGHRSIHSDALKIEQMQSSETFDTVAERVTYNFPTTFPAGSKAELRVGFGGRLTGGMAGYYKSSWEHDGRTQFYALTQFEASSQQIGLNRHSFWRSYSQLQHGVHFLVGMNPH